MPGSDRSETATSAVDELNIDYAKHIQRGRIEATLLRSHLARALQERDAAVSEMRERERAVDATLDALVGSLRPYGLDRRAFTRRIRSTAQGIPDVGPQAVQHGILFALTNRILSALRPHRAG